MKQKLQKTDWKHIAFQYYALFPTHYFKAIHTLENIVGEDSLISWLRHRQKICVLDIGCGTGAGLAAFIEAILTLKEKQKITDSVDVLFVGIDPSHRAIGLCSQVMKQLKSSVNNFINLKIQIVHNKFPDATSSIIQYLRQDLEASQLPCLSNVLVMQLNVISPFSQIHKIHQTNYDELRQLGIEIDDSIAENKGFGTAEALAYKQLIEDVPIDVMHVLTIGTKNMENHVQIGTDSTRTLEERIKEMSNALNQTMSNRHAVEQINTGNYQVYFKNPENSHWADKKNIQHNTDFYVDFQTIISSDLTEDEDWSSVTDIENLKLAWARARNNLLRESLCDETEMRLFEMNLDARLSDLQQQLGAYADDIASADERISYRFPKNISATRPRGLSRIEEEILSVAVIQNLDDITSKVAESSYAYKIQSKDTEYLYEYWFTAYCNYMRKARDSAKRYLKGAVLKVDIESYYTRVIQEQLCEEVSKELRTKSERIRWLIRLLLSKNLDEHQVGQGLSQGSIGSGFYANIYLTPIDKMFGCNNSWGVEFHRYVDDMIFVIPYPDDMNEIEKILKEELNKLGLNLSKGKTEKIYEVPKFLEQAEEDECLERLSERYESIINPLWILNSEHRAAFVNSYNSDERWWHNIGRYIQCLEAISIHTTETELSRKIYKYLFRQKIRERDLSRRKEIFGQEEQLKFTQPPDNDSCDTISQWAACFTSSNNEWSNNRNNLRSELIDLFHHSWQELRESDDSTPSKVRKLQRYIRFALTKLSVLRLNDVLQALMEILREAFWIVRDPINVLEDLARQGYLAEIKSLLIHYQNLATPVEYLKAITIRAMRFLSKIDAQEWELIVEFATISDGSISVAERLMATETRLYLGHKYNNFKQIHHMDAVRNALRTEPSPPSRLKKNYLLLLGQFEPSALQEFSVNANDPMLVDARNIALQGNPSDIFDLPELQILRKNYYSGQGLADSEEGSP